MENLTNLFVFGCFCECIGGGGEGAPTHLAVSLTCKIKALVSTIYRLIYKNKILKVSITGVIHILALGLVKLKLCTHSKQAIYLYGTQIRLEKVY